MNDSPSPTAAILDPETLAMLLMKISPRRLDFCRQYVIDHNGAAAAVRAGYSEVRAKQTAARLVTDGDVAAYISHLDALRASRLAVDADAIVRKYMEVAFATPADYFEDDGADGIRLKPKSAWPSVAAVKSVKITAVGDQGRVVDVQFHDPLKALDALARHLGLFRDRVDVTSDGAGLAPPVAIVIQHRPPVTSQTADLDLDKVR